MEPMVLVSDKPSTILVFYKLNPAIERGTKPDALGWKPCHWTSTLKAAMVGVENHSCTISDGGSLTPL
jgi:hypothetical protein